MALDIIIGVFVLTLGWFGSQSGMSSQIFQLIIYAGGAWLGRAISRPAAKFMVTGIEWPLRFASGIAFMLSFCVCVMVLWFILGKGKDRVSSHSGGLDSAIGGLMGAVGGLIVCYALLGGFILVTQHLGGERAMFAFQFQNSRAGAYVLTHNPVDPEPFPHAIVLQAAVGDPDPAFKSPNSFALADLFENPKAKFLRTSPDVTAAIKSARWKDLRRNKDLMALITDARFLAGARLYMTPVHKIKAEKPEERFEELRQK